MTTTKGNLYAKSLDLARRQGLWDEEFPVDPKGRTALELSPVPGGGAVGGLKQGLSWAELVRKFGKHNPNRTVTAETALAERTIHSLLAHASEDHRFDGDAVYENDYPLDSFPSNKKPAAVSTSDTDKHDGPSATWPPLILEVEGKNAEWALEKVEAVSSGTRGDGSQSERNSAKIILAFGNYALGDNRSVLNILDEANLDPPANDENLEGHELGLKVMGNALEAFALEKLQDREKALSAYARTAKVYEASVHVSQGERNDQLTSWAEEALYRGALLSRHAGDAGTALTAHRAYASAAQTWPANYRLHKRAVVYRSFLRLLFETMRAGKYSDATITPANGKANGKADLGHGEKHKASASWRVEVSSVEKSYESVLYAITKFPKAGDINRHYLDFVDRVVEGWRIGGSRIEDAPEVVDFLYRATPKTFQSQRILRHLVHVLTGQASYEEAKRALTLYYQLWTKGDETGAAEVSREIKEIQAKAEGKEAPEDEEGATDMDSRRVFIDTVTFGARLLCKYLGEPEMGAELMKKAGEVLEGEKDDESLKNDKKLGGKVERMTGIALAFMADQEGDPDRRPSLQKDALGHLERAVSLDPSSFENQYHLAYMQSELREVGSALQSARKAVEAKASSKESWHLLALLVSAQKDLQGALRVVENALEDPEDVLPNGANGNGKQLTDSDDEGGFKTPPEDGTQPSNDASGPSVLALQERLAGAFGGPSAFVGSESGVDFPHDSSDELEAEIQLRMTRNVLLEALEGSEHALQDQQDLFQYFSQIQSQIKGPLVLPKTYPYPARTIPVEPASIKRVSSLLGSRHGRNAASVDVSAKRKSSLPVAIRIPQRAGSIKSAESQRSGRVGQQFSTIDDALEEKGDADGASASSDAQPRASKLLVDLWLMSAATFRRWGKIEEVRGAIQEAENLEPENPDVWLQFALYCLATGNQELALGAIGKALSYSQDHVPSVVHLARYFLTFPASTPAPPHSAPSDPNQPNPRNKGPPPPVLRVQPEYAESLLTLLTQTNGWDVPEAWFLLARAYELSSATGSDAAAQNAGTASREAGKGLSRLDMARRCLLYALELEETKTIRPIKVTLPRCL